VKGLQPRDNLSTTQSGDNVRYWISFDLGLRGEYEPLYAWLDRQQARECGTNLATFLSDKTRSKIAKELTQILDMDRKPRIYIINMREGGKFVIGKRTVAPWTGYGQVLSDTGDERDE
jgi:hypothetical protein